VREELVNPFDSRNIRVLVQSGIVSGGIYPVRFGEMSLSNIFRIPGLHGSTICRMRTRPAVRTVCSHYHLEGVNEDPY
jgi:hypothetical protein